MKKIILNFETKRHNFSELIQVALNKGILNFLVSKDTFSEFEHIERAVLYTKNPIIPSKILILDNKEKFKEILDKEGIPKQKIGFYMELESKEHEKQIVDLAKSGYIDFIIVSAKNWKIIPFENLIAELHLNNTDLVAAVEDIREAELMFKTLEIGVDGILLTPRNTNDIIKLKNLLYNTFHIEISHGKIVRIENIPEAERVCIDSTSLLKLGEGFMVGSTATGFCLIHSETIESQFVATRPFRVNAGDVSAYVLVPDEDHEKIYHTKYLSELKGGDKILAVNTKGEARIVSIGRVKIETRPMVRFELEVLQGDKKILMSYIGQNAETVCLIGVNGKAISVIEIKVGDEVLVHIGPGATHFGTAIKERIIEK